MDDAAVNDLRPGPAAPEGLVALLGELVDYAGLFPPAKLDMATTVQRYAAHRASGEAWMLGRLIVPVARLDEFVEHAGRLPPEATAGDDEPWLLSALTVAADDPRLAADLAAVAAFNAAGAGPPGGALIDVIELRAGSAPVIDRVLDLVPDELFPFFELPVADDPRGLVAALVGGDAGAKIRTGGVTADRYPSVEAVARFLDAVPAAADVPFKATAGLHHPLRHDNDAVGARELGFLNVFVAAALARRHGLDAAALVPVLEAERADAFTFAADGLRFAELRLTVEDVEDARLAFALSFGSCSFREPVQDLRKLGLL